jgi:tartronate-semialdehyde synthase
MAVAGKGSIRGVSESGQAQFEPENKGQGFDFVKFAEACGTVGERVTDPNDLQEAFQRGIDSGIPYIIEAILERETDCSMGVSIDAIKEFE